MKSVVFDTSSLLPMCLHPDREPARILRQTFKTHQVYASQATLNELTEVLKREKINAWQDLYTRMAWLAQYRENVELVEVTARVTDCRDPKDNKFLELALAAKADAIVSSDVHLLELNPYKGTAILLLRDFNERFLNAM